MALALICKLVLVVSTVVVYVTTFLLFLGLVPKGMRCPEVLLQGMLWVSWH